MTEKLIAAKLAMLQAYEDTLNKGRWVTWLNGNQYFVIKPEDFRSLLDPHDAVLDAEHVAATSSDVR
ncbi:hypothetical protein CN198_30065 [Sinorhizobium meliloti]|uniref:hypothetical protein n=1 Tax=Rhizobium meliloti TaxID=382 RepID=UPI000FD90D35|nr:hypothetical protein [Sinorhizobium meliloti]RVH60387.1 hypothetical protein CN198_30065 [Sinorhizobium meliloti]RVK63014.1 hypothetical protein CN159_29410 [Sinorhizobium meliloti]